MNLSAFGSGLLFALGLGLSGMMNPQKVQGFLDLFGRWDPSLALVMGGALAVTFMVFPLIFKREKPIFEAKFGLPTNTKIDGRLLGGAVLFGSGWAISGLCPGPALANLSSLNPGVLLFVGSMLASYVIFENASVFYIRHHGASLTEQAKELQNFRQEQCVVD